MLYGRDFDRTYNARPHVLHIVEDVLAHASPEIGLVSEQLQKDLEELGWRDLDACATDDDRRTISSVASVRTCPSVASGIVDYAKANAIDLIITGTHGRGAVTHLLMGSVAERVVCTAPCPALTVHAGERDFVAPDAMTACAMS